ncbi:MAG: zf-TFIIB domain-containing protein [Giesbergeria sp.]
MSVSVCLQCNGSLLSVDAYRAWVEASPPEPVAEPSSEPLTTLDTPVRRCPHCTRLMERLRVSHQPDFRLDRCVGCQCVWLDAGEWPALVQSGLGLRLTEVLSDGWQRRVREDASQGRREAELRTRHGDACIDELIGVRAWLLTQPEPQRDVLLQLLRSGW